MTATVLGRPGWLTQPPPPPPAPPPPAPPPAGGEVSLSDALLGIAATPMGAMSAAAGEYVKAGVVGVLEEVWGAGLRMLRETLALIDHLTRFDLVAMFGPERGLGQVWPVLWWLAVLVATGVFFSQMIVVVARGGWGASRLVLGPIHFGLALGVILAVSAGMVAAADGIARGLLEEALGSSDFARVLDPAPPVPGETGPVTGVRAIFVDNPDLGEGLSAMTRAVIMAVAGALGIVAAWGFAVEMVVRQAIIVVLVAVSPIAAAGLLSGATSSWWWRTVRWFVAACLLEPALALVLVIGVAMLGGASGIAGLLTGTAVLLAAVFCPWAVYKLLAFVDPATGAGMDLRSLTARRAAPVGNARPGADAVEDTHVARFAEQARAGAHPAPHRAAGVADRARRGGRAVGEAVSGALSAGYHSAAAVGEYAAGRIGQQAAQTGVGHSGGIALNRTPGTRPADRTASPAPAPAPELGGPATRSSAGAPAVASTDQAQDAARDQQQRGQERAEPLQDRAPRPAPEADRRPPKPPPATPPTTPTRPAAPRPDPGRER